MRKLRKPDFGDDRVSLYRGDAIKLLPRMTFDHCICDPPYEDHMHVAKAAARGRKVYGAIRRIRTDGHANPKPVNFASITDLRRPLTQAVVASCSGWFIAFCTPEGIAAWRDEIELAKARYKRALFWCKPDGAPQFNGQGPAFAVECMVSAWCGRGVSKWNGGGSRNYFIINTRNDDREGSHETEKPMELMMKLVELFTKPGDLICDPCMGSGTTIIAAAALGRRAIGIEKDVASFKLARARYAAAFMGRDEGRWHIARELGRGGDAGPLFAIQ